MFICMCLLAGAPRASANTAPNAVTDWALIAQQSIHNAAAPRSAGTSEVLHAMVMLAVYDAVVAIEGGFEPYAARIQAPGADVRAAVATAAYRTARARVAASQTGFLDQQYAIYMANIADGAAKHAGVQVGEQAAAAILARRANDGFGNIVLYECSSIPPAPGEFEPDARCPVPDNADVTAAGGREGRSHRAIHVRGCERIPAGRSRSIDVQRVCGGF
jgi:hypothetical protein